VSDSISLKRTGKKTLTKKMILPHPLEPWRFVNYDSHIPVRKERRGSGPTLPLPIVSHHKISSSLEGVPSIPFSRVRDTIATLSLR
jgi:hypothetical protein